MQTPSLIIILVLFAFAKDVWCYEDRIAGGYDDTVQNNPYIVYIQFQGANQKINYQCGGSIISENYILTAAHCVQGMIKATIRAGSSAVYNGGQQYTSAQIIPHPSFNPHSLHFDVAIIRTTRPIILDGINTKAVKLAEQECDVKPGTSIKVSGWGAIMDGGTPNPTLKSVVLQVITNDVCQRQVSNQQITPCQICASVSGGGKDACKGDSGGPAIVSALPRSEYTRTTCSARIGEQVGVVSYGYGCGTPGLPGVYTRVSCPYVRSWIKRTTGV